MTKSSKPRFGREHTADVVDLCRDYPEPRPTPPGRSFATANDRRRTAKELRRTAIHESGHAVNGGALTMAGSTLVKPGDEDAPSTNVIEKCSTVSSCSLHTTDSSRIRPTTTSRRNRRSLRSRSLCRRSLCRRSLCRRSLCRRSRRSLCTRRRNLSPAARPDRPRRSPC
jgi:hypothetical protein